MVGAAGLQDHVVQAVRHRVHRINLLQSVSSKRGCGQPKAVDFTHFLGDIYKAKKEVAVY